MDGQAGRQTDGQTGRQTDFISQEVLFMRFLINFVEHSRPFNV